MARIGLFVAFVIAVCFIGDVHSVQYFGKLLGKLSELNHNVSGVVYAVDGRTLYIKDFTYDGEGPVAYFYASAQSTADKNGFRLRDENGDGGVIRRYRKEGITLTLPDGITFNNTRIFYVWCEQYAVNFGDVKIPRNFEYPHPQKIDALNGLHSISSDNVVIVDAQTLLIPNLSYDGEAPDAKFWVGPGSKPTPRGIRLPNENGEELPLRKYDRKTVVLTLPGDLTVFDIGHFGIWCEKFTVDFGHIQIPQVLNVPPSLKMLGVSPQSRENCEVLDHDFEVRWAVVRDHIVLQLIAKLEDRHYMSFGLSGDATRSVMIGGDVVVAWVDRNTLKGYVEDYYLQDKSQCAGNMDKGNKITGSCPDIRFNNNTNSVGLLNAAMVNGYSIITYQRPLRASDIYDLPILTNVSQPIIWAIGPLYESDEVSYHHTSFLKGDKFIDFGRPAKWNCSMPERDQPQMTSIQSQIGNRGKCRVDTDKECDEEINDSDKSATRTQQPKEGTEKESGTRTQQHHRGGTVKENESRSQQQSRRGSEIVSEPRTQQQRRRGTQRESETRIRSISTPPTNLRKDAWHIPPIQCYEPENGVFYAQMGPTGGKRGYPAITGHVGWGISWYINGLLIPEVNVVRGKTYTFVVEGGVDPEVSAKYHPFYISDDPEGGYGYKTEEERKNITLFAGVRKNKDGSETPTGTGRLCNWTPTGENEADDYDSFGAYQRTLDLRCDQGEPGVIEWTPDKNTPDTVYYQCFTHRYLGWKIYVHDSCDEQPAASETVEVPVAAPIGFLDKSDTDLVPSQSVRIETRVNPNNLIKEEKEDKEFKSTVSEKKAIPSTIDPLPSTGQPQGQLPNAPILIQPQQSFFDPFYQRSEIFSQHTNSKLLQDQIHYQPYLNYFRPSTQLNTVLENSTLGHREFMSSPAITTVTTTTTTTSTTENPPIIHGVPKITDSIVTASDISNQTYLLNTRPNLPPKFNNMAFRRPPGPNHGFSKHPSQLPMQVIIREPYFPPMRHYPLQKMPYKKVVYRSPVKMPTSRPYHPLQFDGKTKFSSQAPPKRQYAPPAFVSQSAPLVTRSPHIQKQYINVVTEASRVEMVKNIDNSPQHVTTEREPEIQTAPTSIMDITPIMVRPAYNTGFKPGSVKIESGFKPIISKEFQDRMDKDELDIEYESEKGVIYIDKTDQYEFKPIQSFEPMFVPSPTDKVIKEKHNKVQKRKLTKKRYPYTKVILLKRPRSLAEPAEFEEPMAEAAERVETYYLPPSDQKTKPIDVVRRPSNIDIEEPETSLNIDSPPDIVVTYDGKKVSGQSLTAKLSDRSTILDQRVSKATEYIKATPQFGKFKGELPPLNPSFIDKNAPQLQAKSGVLSRDLATPSLPPSSSSSSAVSSSYLPQGLTRLSRVRKYNGDETLDRKKRSAHHTPEHTAQQEETRNSTASPSCILTFSFNAHISIIMVAYIVKYL